MTRTFRLAEWPPRIWHAVRHDIGRKLTALALALLLWGTLENWVVADGDLVLEVRVVSTREEAANERAKEPAIYLVVPDSLLVREVSPRRVTLHVKGLRNDIANLNLAAAFIFDQAQLGTEDSRTFDQALERSVFKSKSDEPTLTDFRVKPDTLSVTLARKSEIDINLTSLNVTTEGRPRDGYFFQESRIALRPSQVRIAGPLATIAALRDDPSLPRLTPVRLAGRSSTVVQLAGLPQELLDAGVTLLTPGNVVEVTIFLVPEDVTRELLSVPVYYLNEDVLATRRQQVSNKDATLDLKVTGPPLEIGEAVLATDDLAGRIKLIYDWRTAAPTLQFARAPVQVALVGLNPETVKVRTFDGDVPKVEYGLEPLREKP